jgi:hypothetical protein
VNGASVSDELVTFVEVLVDDVRLRSWFLGLEALPTSVRAAEFRRMAERMNAEGEPQNVLRITNLLAQDEMYRAVLLTLRSALADR